MKSLGEILKQARKKKGLILRKVSANVDIDQSLISKFEKNERKPTKSQIIEFARFYSLSEKDLLINWQAEKIVDEIKYSKKQDQDQILFEVREKLTVYKLD